VPAVPEVPAGSPEPSAVERYLRNLGADDAQLAEAAARGRLPSLAADLILQSPHVLTPREAAGRLGMSLADLEGSLRTLGLPPGDPDEPSLADADLAVLAIGPLLGDDLLRVAGASLARLAEAAVATYVQTREVELVAEGADALQWAEASAAAGRLVLDVGEGLGSMFVHHVQEATRWQRTSQAEVAERQMARLAVGFVDLTGFTALSRELAPTDLIQLITEFEGTAHDVASRFGGRIVKHIGDEIMFVALDAVSGASIARTILTTLPTETYRPRGGVAYGDLLVRHGDYYCPVVNLASRIVDSAIPSEILLDEHTARAAMAQMTAEDDDDAATLAFEPAGRRLLRGFDEPITTYSMS
jgi:class 3 adenylate cyclase